MWKSGWSQSVGLIRSMMTGSSVKSHKSSFQTHHFWNLPLPWWSKNFDSPINWRLYKNSLDFSRFSTNFLRKNTVKVKSHWKTTDFAVSFLRPPIQNHFLFNPWSWMKMFQKHKLLFVRKCEQFLNFLTLQGNSFGWYSIVVRQ